MLKQLAALPNLEKDRRLIELPRCKKSRTETVDLFVMGHNLTDAPCLILCVRLATTGDLATAGDRIVARPSNQWGRGCYTVQMCVQTTKVVRGIPK